MFFNFEKAQKHYWIDRKLANLKIDEVQPNSENLQKISK